MVDRNSALRTSVIIVILIELSAGVREFDLKGHSFLLVPVLQVFTSSRSIPSLIAYATEASKFK